MCWKLKEGQEHGFNLFDFADRLRTRGWIVPAYTLPANCERTPVQRIVVRHGVSRSLADTLLADMQQAIAYLVKHPGCGDAAESIASGFTHT